jgi:hypothetical protein
MKVDERTVGVALRELAKQTQPAGPPVAAIMQRGQRARRTRNGALAGACVGLVAIAIAAVTTLNAVGPAQPRRAPDEPMTPQLRLAAALQATGQTSFRLRITLQLQSDVGGQKYDSDTYTGAYDPAAGNGYLSGIKRTGIWAQRIVGGVLYVQGGPDTWFQYSHCGPGFYFDNLKSGDGGTLSSAGLSANPAQLLDLLRRSGKVTKLGRQGSGAKAVDRYRFDAAVAVALPGSSLCGEPHPAPVTTINVTGVAEVGVQSGKVGNLTYREPFLTTNPDRPNMWQPSSTYAIKITVQMTDYGLPVVVEPPAHWKPR